VPPRREQAFNAEFLARFLPYLVLSIVLSESLARGRTNTWVSEQYHMVKFWTYTRAVASIFSGRPRKFEVTPKGPGHVPFWTYAPQVALMPATVAAVVWATLAHRFGWVSYTVPGWSSLAFLSNGAWAALNFAVAAVVVRLSLKARQQRADHRFRDRFPVTVQEVGDDDGGRGAAEVALVDDLNPLGMAFRSARPFEAGAELAATLPLSTGTVRVRGRVLHSRARAATAAPALGDTGSAPLFRTGVSFADVPLNVRDRIELHCMQHSVPLEQSQYSIEMLSNPLRGPLRKLREARAVARIPVSLPARVTLGRGGRSHAAVLEELGERGVRVVMHVSAPPGTRIRYQVPGTAIRGRGRVVHAHALETPAGVRFAMGVRHVGSKSPKVNEENHEMNVIRTMRRASVVALAALTAALVPTATEAQLSAVVHGGTEVDTEGFQIFVLGAGLTRAGLGLSPSVSVVGYHLRDSRLDAPTVTRNAVAPMVGLRQQWQTGAVSAHAGYLFSDGEGTGVLPGSPAGGGDGVLTAVQANYWSPAATSAQAIASYNWNANYIWTNLRGSQGLGRIGGPPTIALGAEVQFQGQLEQEAGYRAVQAGVLGEIHVAPQVRLIGVVGGKTDNVEMHPEVFPYFKLEFVAFP
jgi:hypothetical protein